MKRSHNSYIYSDAGNLLVGHDEDAADCPIKDCNWTEHADSDVLDKLCKHIRIEHGLDYSSIKKEDAKQD